MFTLAFTWWLIASFLCQPCICLVKRMRLSPLPIPFFFNIVFLKFLYVTWVQFFGSVCELRICFSQSIACIFIVFFFYHHLQKSGSFHWRHLFSLNFMFTCVGTMPENSCLLLNRKVLSYASLYTSHFVNFCINLGFGSMFSSFSTFSSLSLLAQGPVTTPPLIEKTIFVCLIVFLHSFIFCQKKSPGHICEGLFLD